MNRSMLAALLPLTLLACSTAASENEAGAASDDITSIDDLGPLEANLGLEKDANRTRSEDVVKAGPCYQRMQATGREWQLRRYTKGAAFFFTKAGKPLDPIACVDVDVTHNDRPQTIALSGLSLDIVQRFELGAFTTSEVMLGPIGSSYPVLLSFANGSILLRTGAYEENDQAPTYAGGQFSAAIKGLDCTAFPNDDILGPRRSVRLLMPEVANLAYRVAKKDPRTSMAKDPVGHFVSVMNTTPEAVDYTAMTVRFEKVDVTWLASAAGDQGLERLEMRDHATGRSLVTCSRIIDGSDAPYDCK